MKLFSKKLYKNSFDDEIRTGAEWNNYFRETAKMHLDEIRRGASKGEKIPTLKEQIAWEKQTFTGGGWNSQLVEVKSR